MPPVLKSTLSAVILAFCATSAHADVISLGSIDKTYGSASSRGDSASTGAVSCDRLTSDSIKVREGWFDCDRFVDSFDFSGLDYANVDALTLTLKFSGTDNSIFGWLAEDWKLRVGASANFFATPRFDMKNTDGVTSQTFTFNSNNLGGLFSSITTNGELFIGFIDESFAKYSFNLMSASLNVYGNASVPALPSEPVDDIPPAAGNEVPEPGTLALFGIALAGAGLARRRAAQRATA